MDEAERTDQPLIGVGRRAQRPIPAQPIPRFGSTPETFAVPLSVRERVVASAWYAALAIAILWPLRHGGYSLMLDWSPTPEIRLSLGGTLGIHDAPVIGLLKALSFALPTWVLQRLILLAAFFGAGLAAHTTAPVRAARARLFAGTLYMANPFTLSRLLAGHWRILAGYALVPFAARAIMRLVERPSRRRGISAGAWIVGVGLLSAHLLLIGLLVVVGFVIAIASLPNRRRTTEAFTWTFVIIAIGSAWWLVPAALAGTPSGAGIQTVNVFASTSRAGMSVPVSVLGLHGFWIESLDPSGLPGWPLIGLAFVGLAFVGAARCATDFRRRSSITMILSMVIATLFAIGVTSPIIAPTVRGLYRWIPGLIGLREPHKALVLVALGYAWLGAVAVDTSRVTRKRWTTVVSFVLVAALPLTYVSQLLDGGDGRIHPVTYPASWYAANRILSADPNPGTTLVLPWQLYLTLPFNEAAGRVANPAPDFFSVPILASEDPHVSGNAYPDSDLTHRRLDLLMANDPRPEDLSAALKAVGIKYVLLIPAKNPEEYAFLHSQPDLRILSSSTDLIVFRNLAWRSPMG